MRRNLILDQLDIGGVANGSDQPREFDLRLFLRALTCASFFVPLKVTYLVLRLPVVGSRSASNFSSHDPGPGGRMCPALIDFVPVRRSDQLALMSAPQTFMPSRRFLYLCAP